MNTNCPVCSSSSNKEILKHKKWKIPILQCNNCTHVFASQYVEEKEDSFTTSRARARYYLNTLSPFTPATMMDIGTPSDFFFLKTAHEQYPKAKKYALDLYDKKHPNFVEMVNHFPDTILDISTAFHVLEHVKEPHPFIESIINSSKYFIIEVPNCDSSVAIRDSSCNPHTHFFNERSFKELFTRFADTVCILTRIGKDMPWKKSTLVAYRLPSDCHLKNDKQTPVDYLRTQKLYMSLRLRQLIRKLNKMAPK